MFVMVLATAFDFATRGIITMRLVFITGLYHILFGHILLQIIHRLSDASKTDAIDPIERPIVTR